MAKEGGEVLKDRTCHNVELLTGIVGKPQKHKGKLTIQANSFATLFDDIEGGGYGKQGGIVFNDEEVALELLNSLQEHFDTSKLTLRKEISSFAFDIYRKIKLKIWSWKRAWQRM